MTDATIQVIYTNLAAAFIILLLFMGGYLIMGRSPENLKGSSYLWARRCVGISFLVLALEVFVLAIFEIRLVDILMATMVNLVTYYLMMLLIASSFIRLLDEGKAVTRRMMLRGYLGWAIYVSLLFIVALVDDDSLTLVALILAAIVALVKLVSLLDLFNRIYRVAIERAHNYYSDSVEPMIGWMPKCAYILVVLFVTSSIVAFVAPIYTIITVAVAIFVLIYLFSNFVDLMVVFSNIMAHRKGSSDIGLIPNDDDLDAATLRPSVLLSIQLGVDEWIESKGYLEHGVSIRSISAKICTNRTYLSQYINSKYSCSFRDWIILLRIAEAKRMLLVDPRLTVNSIADTVGFSSSTSLSRAFTRIENISPIKWRDQHLRSLSMDDDDSTNVDMEDIEVANNSEEEI